jgi:SAM-dependent methyltransferase
MCGSKQLRTIINLGKHPLVNRLLNKKDLKKKDYFFPLILRRCKKCSLIQLSQFVDPKNLYTDQDYTYFSSDVKAQEKYFSNYANELIKTFNIKNKFVLEIGSNDGIMLKHFKKKNTVLGVDPATNVVLRALKNNVNTVPLFYNYKISEKIKKEFGVADLIIANNCIAHTNQLNDLVEGISNNLSNKGVFVAEFNYWGKMLENNNYSLIYHEHYSFFSLKVWIDFLKKYRIRIFDACITNAQGGTLRIYCSKMSKKKSKRFKDIIKYEKNKKINSFETAMQFRKNVYDLSKKLKKITYNLKKNGKKISCYGAAAKGMTILKCSSIDKNIIDYFVDDSPAKQGLYSAGDHIPIISRKNAEKNLPDYFIISAPNFSEAIINKEKKFIANGGKFIIPKNDIVIT